MPFGGRLKNYPVPVHRRRERTPAESLKVRLLSLLDRRFRLIGVTVVIVFTWQFLAFLFSYPGFQVQQQTVELLI